MVRSAIANGRRGSATFRHLLDRLASSDLIVHVERRSAWQRSSAFTQFIVATPHARYLRVTLTANDARDAIVGLLGHELRHVIEIADSPWVTDEDAYHSLYDRIGDAGCGPPQWCFDTAAAVESGVQIYEELQAGRRVSAHLTPASTR